jgi:hypothetical protein
MTNQCKSLLPTNQNRGKISRSSPRSETYVENTHTNETTAIKVKNETDELAYWKSFTAVSGK